MVRRPFKSQSMNQGSAPQPASGQQLMDSLLARCAQGTTTSATGGKVSCERLPAAGLRLQLGDLGSPVFPTLPGTCRLIHPCRELYRWGKAEGEEGEAGSSLDSAETRRSSQSHRKVLDFSGVQEDEAQRSSENRGRPSGPDSSACGRNQRSPITLAAEVPEFCASCRRRETALSLKGPPTQSVGSDVLAAPVAVAAAASVKAGRRRRQRHPSAGVIGGAQCLSGPLGRRAAGGAV
ncbi:hypothetical protein AALO_G00268690 [Alosa alosa]|uniref:Uncharacterized protein n=1 Tax=Alosa alosa TaxID=278164 RepID=A0AAV6FQL8_9TELE|nr:hypothetical protein AALO_G00268690 [Alosa alosa]